MKRRRESNGSGISGSQATMRPREESLKAVVMRNVGRKSIPTRRFAHRSWAFSRPEVLWCANPDAFPFHP